MHLLLAYDGSPAARAAVAAAGALFAPATAVVLTVREPELHDVRGAMARVNLSDDVVHTALAEIERREEQSARATADAGAALARDAGLDPEAAVVAATRPWRALEAAAEERLVDLIVCGTHGHGPLGRAFLGSTASSLLHHATTAVLVVPGPAAPTEPVLVAYDGSESARAALRFAGANLRRHRALVTHVWRSPVRHSAGTELLSCLPSDAVRDFVAELGGAYASAARDLAAEGAADAAALGLRAEARTVEASSPWRALLRLAEAERSGLIVTGVERDRTRHAAMGSVATGLVHHACAAILAVPLEVEAEQEVPSAAAVSSPGR
jgi:nucleotide-binding universal stress UspA family protein